ncbi:farnesol dehydrogenase-like [Toxorhynchites rutilus septentrionalis]|uniref:farnesol dehydrogenase-like n=1 Tax=Toxorhynchites rutilus septentrionalis TaxID=329112 RepID=UPI002478558F|nr:farnesol dehydrogenase-like [Toxorhynchites rutilus septentrionalis]
MERWRNRVAAVTGASAGIGWAIAKVLLQSGMVVVGMARRAEKIEELKFTLPAELRNKLHACKCDVNNEKDIIAALKWIDSTLGGADVLVNNAGVLKSTHLTSPGNTEMIRNVVETNIMGLIICSREAYRSMKKRNVAGHIVNMNSVVGHGVPVGVGTLNTYNVYPATKHAVTAITETLRIELMNDNSKVKVTSISPGAVRTEIFNDPELLKKPIPFLDPDDIANSVLHVISTPAHVEIKELTIKPLGERF